jgi:RNA polymerase sigma factor (sigma-70 family)
MHETTFENLCILNRTIRTMDVAILFESNLALIERVIAGVCHRAGMFGADAEDFASAAKIELMENDYAILRLFAERSSLATFLAIVIQRFLIDERTRRTGRWHPSREAERLGESAVVLERIVRRDRRSIDEALPIVQSIDPTLTRERVVEMEKRLPPRTPRPHAVELGDAERELAAAESADARALESDAGRLSEKAGRLIRDAIEAMSLEDRMIIRLHYGSAMTIVEISGILRLPQRPLYRRLEGLLRRLREALTAAGIQPGDLADLIGNATRELDFGLQDGKPDAARQTSDHGAIPRIEEVG